MKFRIDPEKVYLLVFMIFLLGAGLQAAGKYVYGQLATPELALPLEASAAE